MEEDIEKALNNLWNSLDDEFFNLTYSQEQMQEDIRLILNRYNYLDSKIEKLINKYKEQEQFIDWLVGYILDVDEIGYAECSGCKNDKYVGMYRSENKKCVECRIEYFKKQFQKESEGKQ